MKKNILLLLFTGSIFFVNAQWQKANFPSGLIVNCITSDQANIYAGTDSGLYISHDNGVSWSASGFTGKIHSVAINENNIFVSRFYSSKTVPAGVYVSSDNGITWDSSFTCGVNDVLVTVKGSNIFAMMLDENSEIIYISVSADNGVSWTPLMNTRAFGLQVNLFSSDESNIYLNNGVRFFVSPDNGASWVPHNFNWRVQSAISIDGQVFYASFDNIFGPGIYSLAEFNYLSYYASSIVRSGTNIFAGTFYNGVFISSDTLKNWATFNTGLADTNVTILATNETTIFAYTDKHNIWSRPLSDIITTVHPVNTPPDFALYPNPANNLLTIQTSPGYTGEAFTISITNTLGQVISTPTPLLKKEEHATIDINGLPPGVYFVQLTTDKKRCTGKFVKE